MFNVSGMASFIPKKRSDLFRTMVGTPFYAPPETKSKYVRPYNGVEADVWGLGVILVSLLFGNNLEAIENILEDTYNWSRSKRYLSKGTFIISIQN